MEWGERRDPTNPDKWKIQILNRVRKNKRIIKIKLDLVRRGNGEDAISCMIPSSPILILSEN